MPKKEKEIWYRFISGEPCENEELKQLSKWLEDKRNRDYIDSVLSEEWEKKIEKETSVRFEDIQKKIERSEPVEQPVVRFIFQKIKSGYQKAAAILLLPLLVFSAYYFINQYDNGGAYFTTSAARGQKAQVVLPDGTKVWLNSETKLDYPVSFGKGERQVELSGEAFFEVTENKETPFFVNAGLIKIKVTGTSFNLKAYPDDEEAEAVLMEGEIEMIALSEKDKGVSGPIIMKPGDACVFNKKNNSFKPAAFREEEINGWKNNQLIFKDDDFELLAKKIERWYDVEMIYDKEALKGQRLTVELYEGERLGKLLEIIEIAVSAECTVENNKIYVRKKKQMEKGQTLRQHESALQHHLSKNKFN